MSDVKKGLVSVIVPLYNYEKYIGENIESVQNQKYDNWELIIIDDCSTDSSVNVVNKYLKDSRISLISTSVNSGYSTAKNEGILVSRGEYITTIDADDMLTRKSLLHRVSFLRNNPKYQWVHGKAYEFNGTKPYTFRYKKRKAIKRLEKILRTKQYDSLWESIHAQTVMTRRSVYNQVGLYEESMRSMTDKEMWARIINNIGIPGYVNRFVAYYRDHSLQMHRSKHKLKRLPKLKKKANTLIKKRKNGNFEGIRMLP